MVALAVRYFWQKPVTCNARQLLYLAQTALDRGSTADAGRLLQEALHAFLDADCRYHGCRPVQKRRPSSRSLARALNKADQLSDLTYRWVVGMIDLGARATPPSSVRPKSIANALQLIHSFLDDSPYLVESTKGVRS